MVTSHESEGALYKKGSVEHQEALSVSTLGSSSTSWFSLSFSFVLLSEHYTTPATRRVNCELHCWIDFLQRAPCPIPSTSRLLF